MATSKGVALSSLSVVSFPEKPEDAFVQIIYKDGKNTNASGFANLRLSLSDFLKAVTDKLPALKEEITKVVDDAQEESKKKLSEFVDIELNGLNTAITRQIEALKTSLEDKQKEIEANKQSSEDADTNIRREFAAADEQLGKRIDAINSDLGDGVHQVKERIDTLEKGIPEQLGNVERTAKDYTDTQLKNLSPSTGSEGGLDISKLGNNADGYLLTKGGPKAVNAKALTNTLGELGITYDVRLGRYFLDEGVLSEDVPENAGGSTSSEQNNQERNSASHTDDPAVNPEAGSASHIAKGGSGEKGVAGEDGKVVHNSDGGDIKMSDQDTGSPGNPNADPTQPNYGKYWNNGEAKDAEAPYASVDAPVTQYNVTPKGATNPANGFSYIDSLTPTKKASVVSDGNMEIALCPVVRGADPVPSNNGSYPITLSKYTRWQFFISFALTDTSNGSAILSLYPTIQVNLSDTATKGITLTMKRQGKRLVLFDEVSGTTIYPGYQESDESTVQFLIRPELFSTTFAPYKVNDAGSLIGDYSATGSATYVSGNEISETITASTVTDGSFTGKVVYRPTEGPLDSSLLKDGTTEATKGIKTFAYPSIPSVKGNCLTVVDTENTKLDLSGPWLNARVDDVYMSIGFLSNVDQRVDPSKPMSLAKPNRAGGYDIVVPPAMNDHLNGLTLALVFYRRNTDGTYSFNSDLSSKYNLGLRFTEMNDSNWYAGIKMEPISSNAGDASSKKFEGTGGLNYQVGFPSRNVYLSGNFNSRGMIYGNNGANFGTANPECGPFCAVFSLGINGSSSSPQTFMTAKLYSYKFHKNPTSTVTDYVYTGAFNLHVDMTDKLTNKSVQFDVPVNVSIQGE